MDDYVVTNKNFLHKKVNLIKEIRNAFNIGLKEAKSVADQMETHLPSSTVVYGVTVHDEQAFRNIASTGEIRDYFKVPEPHTQIIEGLNHINDTLIGMVTDLLEAKLYDRARVLIDAIEKLES